MSNSARSSGFSLVEVVLFIVVLGIGLAAVLALFNQVTRASVDPTVRKQALALAASIIEEIQLQPFTYCDPGDANVYTATSATVGGAGCAATAEAAPYGPEVGEAVRTGFDNVNDYAGFAMGSGQAAADVTMLDGTVVSALAGYSVVVSIVQVVQDELPGFKTVPGAGESVLDDALRITVTARHPGTGIAVTLQGYRTRYAPNSP